MSPAKASRARTNVDIATSAVTNSLEGKLGHVFAHAALLRQALTHGSLSHEQEVRESALEFAGDNERLEFLGDAVLGLVVAEAIYRQFPEAAEGDLTQMRAALVSRKHLGKVGAGMGLGEHLHLGRSEEQSGGRSKPAILADAVEAVIGAMYLDGGIDPVRGFVQRVLIGTHLRRFARALASGKTLGDAKSELQETLQARGLAPALYSVVKETGPDHDKRFQIEARVQSDGRAVWARALGRSKKQAEQEAAAKLIRKLSRPEANTQGEALGD